MDEMNVLQLLMKQDESALVWVIDHYTPYVAAVINGVTRGKISRSDVEEVSSDVFLVLWNQAQCVQPGKLKPFLGAVARNKAKSKLRGLDENVSLEDDTITLTCDGPQSQLERQETVQLLRQAVLAMKQPVRDIFLRHYYACQSVSQIAQAMNMNPSTVKTHLRRGREKLKSFLEERSPDDEPQNLRLLRRNSG